MMKFDYKSTGFGWLGRGQGFFAPMSVFCLLWQNSRQLAQVPGALYALSSISAAIAKLHYADKISLTNQHMLAIATIAACATEFTPKEYMALVT